MTTRNEQPAVVTKQRQHNLELLRIIAMLMVLIIHYNLPVRGKPTPEALQTEFLSTLFTLSLQSVLIICVNCFVLISGWFGIRWKRRSLLNLCFQVLFWIVACYLLLLLFSDSAATGVQGYLQGVLGKWFVWAYFGLYLFAPVLNDFIDKSSTRKLAVFVASFYVFSTFFGYFSKAVADFNEGMSVISLIGLYMLGALLHRVEDRLPKRASVWFGGYLCCVVLLTVFSLILLHFGLNSMPQGYLNPVVIIESVCLFMFFQCLRFNTPAVLFFSSSAYAVYLCHVFPGECYGSILRRMAGSGLSSWLEVAAIVGFILFVFLFAVLVDKLRIALFNRIMLR